MTYTHASLFSGIGGAELAASWLGWTNVFHCEIQEFQRKVLEYWFPNSVSYEDITKTDFKEWRGQIDILTGGFPCQPFSQAGRRKGTADDRYQWPNMFRVIQNVKPDWVIAENVRGLVTWNDGMVLEQVCTDLESESYEVQPFIIPACAVNAPHRRDRVWIIANCANSRVKGLQKQEISPDDPTNTSSERLRGRSLRGCQDREWQMDEDERQRAEVRGQNQGRSRRDWNQDWREVATSTCNARMDDGLPREVDGISYSFAKWRNESIKAYGNAIVPQVAMELFRAIKMTV